MSLATILILALVAWALLGALAALDYRAARRERWGLGMAIAVGAAVGAALGLLVIWGLAWALGR